MATNTPPDADLLYLAPPESNAATDAEDTGRRVANRNNIPVLRQRSSDPRTHELLALANTLLDQIQRNTDTLEISAENVNLNTDELEARSEAIRAAIATLEATFTNRDMATATAQSTQITRLVELRDRLDALTAKDYATNATLNASNGLLTTLRDTVLRRTDPTPAGQNFIGYIAPSTSQAVAQGRFFLSSSGRMNLGVAGGNLRFSFTNPSTSGKVMSMVRVAGFSSAGSGFASIMLNPTAGLPASTPRPYMNAVAGGGLASAAEVRSDLSSTAMSGGIDTGIVIGIPQNSRFQIDLPPIVVAPGVVVGVNVPYTGTGDVTFSCYWME